MESYSRIGARAGRGVEPGDEAPRAVACSRGRRRPIGREVVKSLGVGGPAFDARVGVEVSAGGLDGVDQGVEPQAATIGAGTDRLEVFGAQAENDVPCIAEPFDRMPQSLVERQVGERQADRIVAYGGRDEVHRRRTDEASHEQIAGPQVELLRRADLLKTPTAQHRNPVTQGERLGLVMCDVHGGHAEPLLQLGDLLTRLHPTTGWSPRSSTRASCSAETANRSHEIVMDLKDLYRDVIVDHNRHPRNFGRLDPADAHADGYNPLCGDRLTVYVNLDGERISEAKFEGSGCAISVASASLLTEAVKGKSRTQVQELFDDVHALLTKHDASVDPARLGKLAALSGVREFPGA